MSKSLKLIVEALLFASDTPITVRDIHSCLPDSKASDIKSALEVLKFEYEELGRSFVLKEVAKGYQFRSRSEYGSYILRMLQTSPNRLSRAAMETLAIIAYKQPILRHELERFRGVDVGGILRTLLEKDLIRIMGREQLPGRPLIYGTTKRFLETFDLKDISSLPKLKEIKALGSEEYEPTPADEGEASEAQAGEVIEEPHAVGDEVTEEAPSELIAEEPAANEEVSAGSEEEEPTPAGEGDALEAPTGEVTEESPEKGDEASEEEHVEEIEEVSLASEEAPTGSEKDEPTPQSEEETPEY